MKIDYTNISVNIPDSIDDLSLRKYLDYTRISEGLKEGDDSISNILKTYDIVGIITDLTEEQIDELLVEEMNDLSFKVRDLLVDFEFKVEPDQHFQIDGVDYVAKDPTQLDNGEYISLNIIRETTESQWDLLPKLLSILIRPGKKEYDFEKKEEVWVIEKYNRRDIENMEFRAQLFLDKAKAKDLIPVLNFFLNMSEKLV